MNGPLLHTLVELAVIFVPLSPVSIGGANTVEIESDRPGKSTAFTIKDFRLRAFAPSR